jgi:hypothetical protein
MSDEHDDEMTPELGAGIRGLPRELAPSDLLEERVVRALKTRSLLGPRRLGSRVSRWAAAVAAALALFFSGLMVGQRLATKRAAEIQVPQTGTASGQAPKPSPRQVFWF